MKKRKLIIFGIFLLNQFVNAQIYLDNGSFEGEPQDATVPVGWHKCAKETTPDILPGFWGVNLEASEGDTFMGLITRENGTVESIGQRLKLPLKFKECYTVSMDLAYSNTYAGYNQPLKLRIWGGKRKGGKDQLIAETDFINHTDWESYSFQFIVKKSINYFILEAHYSDEPFSVRGNILIDNISPLSVCIRASVL